MDPFVGQIECFAFDYAPRGWLTCQGQLLSIAEYQTLYSLLGTTYGGDGQTTFALPDLRDVGVVGAGQKLPRGRKAQLADGKGSVQVMGLNYCIATEGVYPPRP